MRGTGASPFMVACIAAMNRCCLDGRPSLLAGVERSAGATACLRSGLMLMHSLAATQQHRPIGAPHSSPKAATLFPCTQDK